MLLKGIIQGRNDNKYMVRIPSFESAGQPNQFICSAIVSYTPGSDAMFRNGDVVVIGFENNNIDRAVVLGKLYTGEPEQGYSSSSLQNLNVEGTTILSSQTTIGGLKYTDLLDMLIRIEGLETRVQALEEKVEQIPINN